jgi:hypothetical protein
MPYTPTGTEGNAAAAADLAVFDGNENAASIYVLLNVRGDEIAAVLDQLASISWSTITGKPSTFTPSSHSHDWSDITGEPALVSLSYFDQRLAIGGSQPIYSAHGRSNPVVTSWVAAALDSQGRIAIQPSSIRFKTIIDDFDGSALDLDPVRFTLNGDETEAVHIGFIAEQVEDTLPEAVVNDEHGEPLALDHNAILAALVADVRRLSARVAELEQKGA